MHNIKDIRKDFAIFAKSLETRSLKIDFETLRQLDEKNRQLIHELVVYFFRLVDVKFQNQFLMILFQVI